MNRHDESTKMRIAALMIVIAAAAGECDAPEICMGTGTTCPVNGFRPSGTACTSDSNPCTTDVCNATGTCGHIDVAANTSCGTNRICCGGTCMLNTSRTTCGRCGVSCGTSVCCPESMPYCAPSCL